MRLAAGAALVSVGLVGCSSSERDAETPVPETAAPPFACPGVPLRGAELMSGNDSLAVIMHSGAWGDVPGGFYCVLADSDDQHRTALRVEEWPVESIGFGPTEAVREQMRRNNGSQRIEADHPGVGYVWTSGDGIVNAWWVCNERVLQVDLYTHGFEGRDGLEDVSRYVRWMLPWACGGEDVPDDA